MPVSLAEAKNNVQEDLDVAVIDEFRKESAILDTLIFDDAVNPSGGGATLDYGYRRLVTQADADFRAINSEYAPAEVESQKYSVTLAPLGGSFRVDRVLAKLGPAASGAVTLNLQQKIKATRTRFQDEVINGDTAVDADGFDGLDKALTGSDTEMDAAAAGDWLDLDTDDRASFKALDLVDEFLALLDGTPTVLVANKKALARVRAIVRRSGMYVRDAVEGLVGANGRPINRESYGGITLVDAGEKAGSNDAIIPIAEDGTTSIYAYRVGLDGFHGVSTAGGQLVQTWMPDFTTSGAVKTGEVELGPVGIALKATKAAAVLRGVKVAAG
ncbi:hypothetical protein GCM10010915_11900 [Microbacterium faecale]|uniref:Phage capsid protein n=1 Tax=Microbacterium faecale TaxID=1804630 RepID=A0A916Y713_9MICO|nr:phage capsid protein [Microbacterium faecale]GGD33128.1 hypothetical protein GCM10010915_11900 [Microbacterium faecale]